MLSWIMGDSRALGRGSRPGAWNGPMARAGQGRTDRRRRLPQSCRACRRRPVATVQANAPIVHSLWSTNGPRGRYRSTARIGVKNRRVRKNARSPPVQERGRHPLRSIRPENHMRPNPGFRASCALAFVIALAACGRDGAAQQNGGGGDRPVPVTTTVVAMRPWSDTVLALGNVKARESITVTAKVSETVEKVHFDSGDSVAEGAPLITLTGNQQQAALQQAEAAAAEAERLYQRQNELAAQQLIARSSLDTQRAARDVARARVAQMRADIG